MTTAARAPQHTVPYRSLLLPFLLLLLLLVEVGCTTHAEPRPEPSPEPNPEAAPEVESAPETAAFEKTPDEYFTSLRDWEDFLKLNEEELLGAMPVQPDTAVTAEDQRILVYHLEPNKVARFFVLQQEVLAEDLLIFYFKEKEEAQYLYEQAAAYFGGLHGTPTLEAEGGAMWNLYTEGVTDALRKLISRIRKRGTLPSEELTLGALLEAAPEAQQHQLIDLLRGHRSARVYLGAHLLANVYTVTIVRSAGPRALWSPEGERIALGAL